MATTPGTGLADPEDAKLVTLARAALGRAYTPRGEAAQGAAVRDTDGRTYAAASVGHADPAWATSALRGAVAAAVSSGARRFEAAVVLGAPLDPAELVALGEFGAGVPVYVLDADASLVQTLSS